MKSELSLTVLIFIFLFAKIGNLAENNRKFLMFANIMLVLNFAFGFFWNGTGVLFSGMFVTHSIIGLEKNILNLALMLVSFLSYDWLSKNKNASEFYMLLLSSQLGMFFMLSSGNFLMFFLAMELSTIPLAALSNFDLDRPKSSEAAFKLIMSSAFASCIMLFGLSLLYGTTGTLDFSEMRGLITMSHLQVMAFVFVFVGLAFKLSLVPFHLWTADVYEGSPVSITATLAVISKGAFIFVFMSTLFIAFGPMIAVWEKMIMLSIMVTITIGNFMAVRQSNLKRLLAFSSISQVGYLLMGIVCGFTPEGASSVIYFMLIYVLSSLAMFAVVAVVFNQTGKEEVNDYRGFYQNNKLLSWVVAIALFSLAGIPPTAGFFGKYFLLAAGAGKGDYILLGVVILNMVVSLYYYLRVIRAIFIDKGDGPSEKVTVSPMVATSIIICVAGVLCIGFAGDIFEYVHSHFYMEH
ncbi:MAG TPA: NADH-quinone oxidoreductase subunit N [Bacteroidia bacterium]|nr:NADH-quinone oxidoreductase subunit N [Bacteroidia bacterium]